MHVKSQNVKNLANNLNSRIYVLCMEKRIEIKIKLNMYTICLINDFGFSDSFLAYSGAESSADHSFGVQSSRLDWRKRN